MKGQRFVDCERAGGPLASKFAFSRPASARVYTRRARAWTRLSNFELTSSSSARGGSG